MSANVDGGDAGRGGTSANGGGGGTSGARSDGGLVNADGGAVDAGSSYAGLFEALDTLRCGAYRACCSAVGLATSALDDCEAEVAARGAATYQAIDAGRMRVDVAALTACVDAVQATLVECRDLPEAWLQTDLVPDIDACRDAVQGQVAEGDACSLETECAQGATPARCVRAESGSRCRTPARGALGDACVMTTGPRFRSYYPLAVETDAECRREDALYCDGADGDYACVAVKATGEACTTAKQCAADAYCAGTCQPLLPVGADCTSSMQCAGWGCGGEPSTCSDRFLPSELFCSTLGIQ